MKILIPVDFSEQSENACFYAMSLASGLSAELKFLNAFYDPFIDSDHPIEGMGGSVTIPMDYLDSIRQEAESQMRELLERLDQYAEKEGLSKVTKNYELVRGFPEHEIITYAESYKPDLLIMGTNAKEKSGLNLFGSVTAKLMSKADFPILAVPSEASYSGIQNIMYATDFENADADSIRKILHLFDSISPKVLCAHIHLEDEEPWTSDLLKMRKTYFRETFPEGHVEFDLVESKNLIDGTDFYINEKSINVIAFTMQKRNVFTRLLNPSKTKKMLFHTSTPLLVFHQHG